MVGRFIILVKVVEKGRTKEQFDNRIIIRSINKAAVDKGLYLENLNINYKYQI
jgi:hypothetical protein